MSILGEDITPKKRELSAEELAFSYDQRLIIDGISLEIPEHTTTAIVGPSGSGKTTLVSLLARFWDPEKGKVLLGARNVKDYDMDSLMANFSFVFQNVYLFHDSILNNIRFARPELTEEKTVILIAHRLKTVSKADQILVLEQGKIVQKGSHEELLQEDGLYKDFIQERKRLIWIIL